MNLPPLLFPRDLLKFLYWCFFKPLTLERYMQQIDPKYSIQTSIITLWRNHRQQKTVHHLLRLALFHILVTPGLIVGPLLAVFALAGIEIDWLNAIIGGGIGIACGMVWSVIGGWAMSAMLSMIMSIITGTTLGVGIEIIFFIPRACIAESVTTELITVWCVVLSFLGVILSYGMVLGMITGILWMSASWITVGNMTLAIGASIILGIITTNIMRVLVGTSIDIATGMMIGLGFIISYLRLILYLFEAPWSYLITRFYPESIHRSPLILDEIIWLPLPGIDQQLVALTHKDRARGLEAIAHVADSFRQGWAARAALLELLRLDLTSAQNLLQVAGIVSTLGWLPETLRGELKNLLAGLEQIGRHAQAALQSDTLYNRQEQLRQGQTLLVRLRGELAFSSDVRIPRLFGAALQSWEAVFAEELRRADAQEHIPNVYVAGSPLARSSQTFKGRRDLFLALERELASGAEQRPALLLFGARRTGKTSVLHQLPDRLGPQVVPVEVDLQELSTAENAAGLLGRIAQKICADAYAHRRLNLPELPAEKLQDDPYLRFGAWLKEVEAALGAGWLLLTLDEYEALEKMVRAGRLDERIYSLLRGLAQNYARVVLLLSGAHTPQALDPVWSHHLVNLRTLKIGTLRADEARELVIQPIPAFPLSYAPDAVERLLAVTGGQPYLIQTTCRDLVNALNGEKQLYATLEDVNEAITTAMDSATAYFDDLWRGPDSSDEQRSALAALARGEPLAQVAPAVLRKLEQRELIEKDETGYRFRVEMVRMWVNQAE